MDRPGFSSTTLTASTAVSSSYALTSSWANTSVFGLSSSYASSSDASTSSSFAQTASYVNATFATPVKAYAHITWSTGDATLPVIYNSYNISNFRYVRYTSSFSGQTIWHIYEGTFIDPMPSTNYVYIGTAIGDIYKSGANGDTQMWSGDDRTVTKFTCSISNDSAVAPSFSKKDN